MRDPEALAVVHAAINLSRTHRHAPLLDVLDLVMKGHTDQSLDFADSSSPNGSLASPGAPFGQLLAAALDEAMTPTEWATFTGAPADSGLRGGCLEIWRVYVVPRFAARFEWSGAVQLDHCTASSGASLPIESLNERGLETGV